MEYYKENLKILKVYKKSLYQNLIKLENDLKTSNDIQSNEAKDGNLILSIEQNGKQYRLNSSYKPFEQAKKWADQFELNNMYQVISMFGLGNGIFANELIKKLKKTDNILIYEPNKDIFIHVLENYDLSDIFKKDNVSITVKGINDNEFHNVIQQTVNWINLHSQLLCQHPYYDELYEESYMTFLKEIKSHNERTIINRNTVGFLGTYEAINTIENIRYIKQSNTVSELKEYIPSNIPAIIVAAGPSLDKNVEELKYAKGKAFIISTDRALTVLLNHNIEPDFVITLDPIKPIKYFTDRENIEIPLMYRMEANHEILKFHTGRKFVFHSERFIKKLYENLGKNITDLNPGGSVATAAFSVCVSLGFERIILIGQDLAYGNDNITHAGEEKSTEVNIDDIMVPDIFGNLIRTRYDWVTFLNWLQDAIALYNKIDVIDATEGGAKIEGTRIMKLKDAINDYCIKKIDVPTIVKNLPPTMSKSDMEEAILYIKDSLEDLNDIHQYIDELLEINNALIQKNNDNNTQNTAQENLLKRMRELNNLILEKNIYSLVDNYISKNRTDELFNIYKLTGDEVKDREVTYKKAGLIYKSIKDVIDEVKPKLISSLNIINDNV